MGIADNAFKDLGIESVTFSHSLSYIGDYAFSGNELETITFETTVKLGSSCFANNKIDELNIKDVYDTRFLPFEGNPLSVVNFSGDNIFETYLSLGFPIEETGIELIEVDGFIFAKEYGMIVGYDESNGLDVVIPNTLSVSNDSEISVTEIGNYAFYNKGITSVTFPDILFSIRGHAFADNNLTEIDLDFSGSEGSVWLGIGSFMNNQLSSISVDKPFIISKDLFKGNNMEYIEVDGSKEYYLGVYQLLGLEPTETLDQWFNMNVISGINNDPPIRIKPILEVNNETYILDFEIDMHSTNTSQAIDVYKLVGNTYVIQHNLVIEESSIGYTDSIVLDDGTIYVLGYIVPNEADSNTYLPGVMIEFNSDFTEYELHYLNNTGMRIPRSVEVNDNGDIGIIGEGGSYMDSMFYMYNSDFEEVTSYLCDDDIRCRYTKIVSNGDNFIVAGMLGDDYGCGNSTCYDIIIHEFDSTGKIHESEFESEGAEEVLSLVTNGDNSYSIVYRVGIKSLVFKNFDENHNLLNEKEIDFYHETGVCTGVAFVDNEYIFAIRTYSNNTDYYAFIRVNSSFEVIDYAFDNTMIDIFILQREDIVFLVSEYPELQMFKLED